MKKKRFLTVFLSAVILVCSLLSSVVFAEENDTEEPKVLLTLTSADEVNQVKKSMEKPDGFTDYVWNTPVKQLLPHGTDAMEEYSISPMSVGEVIGYDRGDKIYFSGGTRNTNKFEITTNNGFFYGFCAEASKSSPSPYQDHVQLNYSDSGRSSTVEAAVKLAILCQNGFALESLGNQYFTYTGDDRFFLIHYVISYLHAGDLKGVPVNEEASIISVATDLLSKAGDPYYRGIADQVSLYYIKGNSKYQQDVVWLEGTPVTEKYSNITIYKKDYKDKSLLSGATFELWGSSGDGSSFPDYLGTFTDNKDGSYSFKNINVTTYKHVLIKETKAPAGYRLPYHFNNDNDEDDYNRYKGRKLNWDDASNSWLSSGWGTPEYDTFYDEKLTGILDIRKVSSDPSITDGNGNYSLAGAEYTVYKTGTKEEVGKIVTDNTGYGSIEVDAGTYDVVETKAPTGFEINNHVYKVVVDPGQVANVNVTTVEDSPVTTIVKLKKVSESPEYVGGNMNYSLEGAVYGVYRDESCTNLAGKITTDANGNGELGGLSKGIYWVKELTASKGYELDTTKHKVDLTNNTSATVTSIEPVLGDPVSVFIKKVDSVSGNTPAGNASLAGAQFTIKFYDEVQDTDPALQGNSPLRTWVFETKYVEALKQTLVMYSNDFKISGDELYTDIYGGYMLPVGTITIQETKSPNGYKIDNTVYVIKMDGTESGGISDYQVPEIANESSDLKIVKTGPDGTTPVEGVVFKHEGPDGFTESLTTDKKGELSFRGLKAGKHVFYETSVPHGYKLSTAKLLLTVKDNGTIEYSISGDSEGWTFESSASDTGFVNSMTLKVSNKAADFTLNLHKINDKDMNLQGAEFTLYSDKACTKKVSSAITDVQGMLSFKNVTPGVAYYLKETKAPAGYRLDVDDNGNVKVYEIRINSNPATGVYELFVDGTKYNKDTGDFCISGKDLTATVTVVNNIQMKLPNTGSSSMVILVVIGSILMGTGLVFSRRKRI